VPTLVNLSVLPASGAEGRVREYWPRCGRLAAVDGCLLGETSSVVEFTFDYIGDRADPFFVSLPRGLRLLGLGDRVRAEWLGARLAPAHAPADMTAGRVRISIKTADGQQLETLASFSF